jgi:hypothetical protein
VERLFGVEDDDGEDLALEFERGIGLGRNWVRRLGWSLSTTVLRGLLILIDLPLGIGGEAGVREGVDMVLVVLLWTRRRGEMLKLPTDAGGGLLVACRRGVGRECLVGCNVGNHITHVLQGRVQNQFV